MSYSDILKFRNIGKRYFRDLLYSPIPPVVSNGLVMNLRGADFTNSPPTTTWHDESGLGNNATPSGFGYIVTSGSDGQGGVVFDGAGDKVSIPYNSSMSLLGNNFTITARVKFNGTTTQMFCCRRTSITVAYEYMFYYTSSGFTFGYSVDGVTQVLTTFPFTMVVGTLYDITLKRVGTSLYLYINGVKQTTVDTITGSLFASTVALIIGASNSSGTYSNFFNGTVKRILQYNRDLTDAEIAQNYNVSK